MSSLRSHEIKIPAGKPFENCKLGREKYAEILTQIIENYSDGFVLSVNNKWGEGKTTFIKMWKVYLGNNGFKNVYFNAWEHDFGQDPMAAILSQIKSLNIGEKADLEGIIKKAGKFSINAVPIILEALAKKHIDTESITTGIKELSKNAIDAFQGEVEEYAQKKKSLEEFKEALASYVKILPKPLVFVIDELDRCNPKYAVDVLEIIKHFFSVPGIVFVLSIDKEQLGNAIRGYYGSDRIDADEYLRRFIDLEYSLPRPNIEQYLLSTFEKLNFKEFFGENRKNESNRFLHFSYWIMSLKKLSLRQIEKLFIQCRIALKSVPSNNLLFPDIFFFLNYLKYHDAEFYDSIKDKDFIVQDVPGKLHEWFSKINIERTKFELGDFEILLIYLYNKSRQDFPRLYEYSGQRYTVNFRTKISKFSDDRCAEKIINLEEGIHSDYNIDYIIKRIDLMEKIEN